jgi:hypothetical protein
MYKVGRRQKEFRRFRNDTKPGTDTNITPLHCLTLLVLPNGGIRTKRVMHTFTKVYSYLDMHRTEADMYLHMAIARQRLGKHIPEITLSTIGGYPLLGNETINTHS